MLNVPEEVKGLSHPRIASAFITKKADENILILEMHPDMIDAHANHDLFDSYLNEVLMDLEELKRRAEEQAGSVDHIDIRRMH